MTSGDRQEIEDRHTVYRRAVDAAERARVEMMACLERARAAGATNREIGDVLGVSRQRVSQLLRKDTK